MIAKSTDNASAKNSGHVKLTAKKKDSVPENPVMNPSQVKHNAPLPQQPKAATPISTAATAELVNGRKIIRDSSSDSSD
jgi:hypothetical protein